jgi:hypothetical protein
MRSPTFKLTGFVVMLVAGSGSPAGCKRHVATDADCLAIVHRLVELELTESGFPDPIVRDRWQHEISVKLSSDLGRCRGRRVPDDLTACLNRARTQEGITHGCLR